MASKDHIDDADDDFEGDFTGTDSNNNSGNKRGFGDLEKTNSKETYPGAETGTILHLRESLRSCEDTLATCQLAVKDSELRCLREKQPKSPMVEEKEKVDSPQPEHEVVISEKPEIN